MIKVTRWKPDTCGCDLEYEWDDAVPLKDRVHSIKNISKACDAHKNIVDAAQHFNEVVTENANKNKAIAAVCEKAKELDSVITSDDIKWRIDAQRNIIITAPVALALMDTTTLKSDLGKISNKVILENG